MRYRGPRRGSWDTKSYRDQEKRPELYAGCLAVAMGTVMIIGGLTVAKLLGVF